MELHIILFIIFCKLFTSIKILLLCCYKIIMYNKFLMKLHFPIILRKLDKISLILIHFLI